MSGLDEQDIMPKCPSCGVVPGRYYISKRNRKHIGDFGTKRDWQTKKKFNYLKFNRENVEGVDVENNPLLYIERIRCAHCMTLFSQWIKKKEFNTLLLPILRKLREGSFTVEWFGISNEPRWGY